MDLSARNGNFYDVSSVKEKIMEKTVRQVIRFDKLNKRSYHGSIYMKEYSPDYYDS
jgi:hypothetical protein